MPPVWLSLLALLVFGLFWLVSTPVYFLANFFDWLEARLMRWFVLVDLDFLFSQRVLNALESSLASDESKAADLMDQGEDFYCEGEQLLDVVYQRRLDIALLKEKRFEHYLRTPCWRYRVE